MKVLSPLEEQFARDCRAVKLPTPEREYRFEKTRKWRFDFAWPEQKLAVEIQGGIWLGRRGGHTSPAGRTRDCEKMNGAVINGWRVLQFTGEHVTSGRAIALVEEALCQAI